MTCNPSPRTLCLGWVTLALAAGSAQAQGKKGATIPACTIDVQSPGTVKSAMSALTVSQLQKQPVAKRKNLVSAVGDLTGTKDQGKNPAGRELVLGQALSALAILPNEPAVVKRSDAGYATNPAGTVDLLAAADSAFTAVEQSNPQCAPQVAAYRQNAWAPLIKPVPDLVDKDSLARADSLLQRSLVIYRGSPYSFYLAGNIAQRQHRWMPAAADFRTADSLITPAVLAKDTTLASVREYSRFALALSTLKSADSLPAAQRKAKMAEAAKLYQAYLAQYPNGTNAKPARLGLTIALQQSGDTTAMHTQWKQMAANPGGYSAEQLIDAGAQAFQAKDLQTAVALTKAGTDQNGWLQTGLFNLGTLYWKLGQFDNLVPIAERLIQIAPNNPDNYELAAIGFQGLEKAAKSPAARRANADSVTHYLGESHSLPVEVTVSGFTHDSSSATVAGTVQNLGKKAKSVTLQVDFLDAHGKVVNSQSANVSAGPQASAPFSVKGTGAAIAAYRYSRIS